jgi:regulator of sigma E protease
MLLPLMKILLGLLGLTLVVSVHELGHFFAARLFKIDVITFSVGLGKKLLVIKGARTEWALSLLPLGGYCRLKGEQNFIQAWEEKSDHIPYEEGSLFSAPWWQRVILALAGPVANLIFGALILSLTVLIRYPQTYVDPYIIPVSHYDNSQQWPADEAGLLRGDKIIKIGDQEITRYDQIQENVILSGGETLIFTIERDGEILTIPVTPGLNRDSGTGYVGVYPFIPPVIRESPELYDFLMPGDIITSLNNKEVACSMDFFQILDKSGNRVEQIELVREGEALSFTPGLVLVENDPYPQFSYHKILSPSMGLLKSISEGITMMADLWMKTLRSTAILFKGVKLSSALSGPLRISWMTGEVAWGSLSLGFRAGLYQMIQFLSLLCAALAFANLLPIPILDGGQIVLHIIDGLRRRALTPQFIYYYQMAGTVLVLGLALFATGNDLIFFLRS